MSISNNESTANNGGAIFAEDVDSVNICSGGASGNTAVISGNSANQDGGAIYTHKVNNAVANTINVCSGTNTASNKAILYGNTSGEEGDSSSAEGNNGGAIFANVSAGINISSATGTGNVTAISGNTANNGNGGAIYAYDFDVLNLCTGSAGNQAIISGNTAMESDKYTEYGNDNYYNGNGGGIYTNQTTDNNPGVITLGTVDMTNHHGDIVISDNRALNGGGIYTQGYSQLEMYGGYITLNESGITRDEKNYYWNYLAHGGGGLYLLGNTVMNMYDGYITGNNAARGGGIFTQHQGAVEFHMSGGFVSSNTARDCEGGGICIESGTMAYFLAENGKKIYITNNETTTKQHWGGGGLFIADGGYGFVHQMLVTDNYAGGYGGGIAGCSTGRIHLFMNEQDGAAIYGNSADGIHTSGESSAKNFDRLYATINEVFNSHGYEDYFCALNSEISGGMLGGNPAFWSGSADGVPIVSNSTQDMLISAYMMGLTAHPTEAGKTAAQGQATFYINNNKSFTHGGGALINGYMVSGNTTEINLSTSLKLNGTKALINSNGHPAEFVQSKDENGNPLYEDEYGRIVTDDTGKPVMVPMEHERFSFSVIDTATGAVVATGHNEEDGSIFFSELLSFTKEGVYQYYIVENDPGDPNVTWDTTIYRLTVTIERKAQSEEQSMIDRLVGDNQITRYQYVISYLLVEKYNGEKSVVDVEEEEWKTVLLDTEPKNHDNAPSEVTIGGSTTFTNMLRGELTSVKVTKKWADNGRDHSGDSVFVQLYRNDVPMEKTDTKDYSVTLNSANNWTYEWTELPVKNMEDGTTYTYTVKEDAVQNYVPEYTTRTDVEMSGIFVPMEEGDNIEVDGKYLIVSPDGNSALCVSNPHRDKGLNDKDVVSVTLSSAGYEIDGKTYYDDYYLLADVNPASIYTAIGGEQVQAPPVLAAGSSGESCLLIQTTTDDDNISTNLKDCAAYYYGSSFAYEDGMLIGKYEWSTSGKEYVVTFDGSKFGAVLKNPDQNYSNSAAKVYKLLEEPATGNTTIVITNRLAEHLTYNLDVTKYSGIPNGSGDLVVKLADAKFQLKDSNDNLLSFTKTTAASAAYQLADKSAEGATAELVTDQNGKLVLRGLPADTYTLVETEAPRGYLLAEPVVITEDKLTEGGYTYTIDVVDPPMTYTLPETGGTGTYLYTLGGLMLTMAAAILLYIRIKRRKEASASS